MDDEADARNVGHGAGAGWSAGHSGGQQPLQRSRSFPRPAQMCWSGTWGCRTQDGYDLIRKVRDKRAGRDGTSRGRADGLRADRYARLALLAGFHMHVPSPSSRSSSRPSSPGSRRARASGKLGRYSSRPRGHTPCCHLRPSLASRSSGTLGARGVLDHSLCCACSFATRRSLAPAQRRVDRDRVQAARTQFNQGHRTPLLALGQGPAGPARNRGPANLECCRRRGYVTSPRGPCLVPPLEIT